MRISDWSSDVCSSDLFTFIERPQDRKADRTARHLAAMLQPLPSSLRRSIAFDNGSEFARHHQLSEQVDIQTFFCDVRSPWQKGGVENAIGRIRRSLPRNANLDQLPQQDRKSTRLNYSHQCSTRMPP